MPRKATTPDRRCEICGSLFVGHPGKPNRFCSHPCRDEARKSTEDHFWSRVDRSGGPDGCWLWIGGGDGKGYGSCKFRGRMIRTHILAWELTHGPISDRLCVCHDCPGGENRRCCNPRHLFLGTRKDNNADRDRKGHHVSLRGERHGRAKLSPESVIAIRRRSATGDATFAALSREFGVSETTIADIVRRKIWRHL